MNPNRAIGLLLLSFTVVAITSLAFTGGGAGQATQCEPIEDRQLCLTELTVSPDTLVIGEQGEFSVTVANEGNKTASGNVLLHTASPDNETDAYQMEEITLETGETHTISREINANTSGTHGLRFSLIEPTTQHVFDITAVKTIEVREEQPNELGGPIDRTEIALGALIAAVLGILVMGYRQLNS